MNKGKHESKVVGVAKISKDVEQTVEKLADGFNRDKSAGKTINMNQRIEQK